MIIPQENFPIAHSNEQSKDNIQAHIEPVCLDAITNQSENSSELVSEILTNNSATAETPVISTSAKLVVKTVSDSSLSSATNSSNEKKASKIPKKVATTGQKPKETTKQKKQ